MRERPLYQELARLVDARKNCLKSASMDWYDRHSETIEALVNLLPSGSGFDQGTTLDLDRSSAEKLIFHTSFHHMDEGGYYDGWTEHTVTVTPSLPFDFRLLVSGRDRNDIKDYIHEQFEHCLRIDVLYDLYVQTGSKWAIKSKWLDACTLEYSSGGETFRDLDTARRYAGEHAYEEFMAVPHK